MSLDFKKNFYQILLFLIFINLLELFEEKWEEEIKRNQIALLQHESAIIIFIYWMIYHNFQFSLGKRKNID